MMGTEMSIMAIFMVMYMMDPGGLMGMDMTHQKRISQIVGVLAALLTIGRRAPGWLGLHCGQRPSPASRYAASD